MVTGPDLRSGKEAAAYAAELRRIMVLLGILDTDMQVRAQQGRLGLHLCCVVWADRQAAGPLRVVLQRVGHAADGDQVRAGEQAAGLSVQAGAAVTHFGTGGL